MQLELYVESGIIKGMKNVLLEKLNHGFLPSQRKSSTKSNESVSPLSVDTDFSMNLDGTSTFDRVNRMPLVAESEEERDLDMDVSYDGEGGCFQDQDDDSMRKLSRRPTLNTNAVDALNWYASEQQVCTPVMTPVNPSGPSIYLKRHDSVSSLGSSVSELGYTNRLGSQQTGGSIPANFSQKFINLLIEVYSQVCSDPMVTPFDTCNPPAGILNRVSRLAVDRAEREQIDIGVERNSWLLTLIRQRLLTEVKRDSYLSRNSSIVSLPPIPQFGSEGMLQSGQTSSSSQAPSQDYFSCFTAEIPSQPALQHGLPCGLNSPFDSRPSSQSSLLQPQQINQQLSVQHHKPLGRTRSNNFISAASRSRSNSFQVYPQITTGLNVAQTQQLPALSRSRSASNGHFAFTPVTSVSTNGGQYTNTSSNNNESIPNNISNGQYLDERYYFLHPPKQDEDIL